MGPVYFTRAGIFIFNAIADDRITGTASFTTIAGVYGMQIVWIYKRFILQTLFAVTILLIVYLPLRIIQKCYSTLLPYNISLTADTPLSELSLELLILQVRNIFNHSVYVDVIVRSFYQLYWNKLKPDK